VVERAHEDSEIDRGVGERQVLGAADEIARAAGARDRRRELVLRDLDTDDPSAEANELPSQAATTTADVDDVLASRVDEALEHR
jgi:hypothetical protein